MKLFKWFYSLFEADLKFHDYRRLSFGHGIQIVDESLDMRKVRFMGQGVGIEVGEFVVIKASDSGWSSYRVDEISYRDDPPDMFFADCTWSPGVFKVSDGEIVRC